MWVSPAHGFSVKLLGKWKSHLAVQSTFVKCPRAGLQLLYKDMKSRYQAGTGEELEVNPQYEPRDETPLHAGLKAFHVH